MLNAINTFKKSSFILLMAMLLFSCDETIFETDISDEKVKILAPLNDTSIEMGTISFNWQLIDDATEYQIQIATPNFAQASQIIVDEYTTTSSFSKELEVNDYEWRVRALNSAYETVYSSVKFSVH